MRVAAWITLTIGVLALSGCSADEPEGPLPVPQGCNPLAADVDCLLPFPSDVFLVDDSSMPSTKRVEIPTAAQFRTSDAQPVDMLALHPVDGFSQGTQILALLPGGIDEANLVTAGRDPFESLEPPSATVLLRVADSGQTERVLHLAETDPRAPDDTRRGLLIRPLVRLEAEQRYIVAVRSLRHSDGSLVQAPEGFARIRDRLTVAGGVLHELASHYEADIFPLLTAAGVSRSELQLAWDFTTGSQEHVTRDMFAVREDIVSQLTAAPPSVEVVQVTDDVDEHTYRRIEATVEVPLYVESEEIGARLRRDEAGNVVAAGTVAVPFTVLIPQSVAGAPPTSEPARILQFGHGFFGSRDEVWAFIDQFADAHGFVVVAADWWGMSEADKGTVIEDLTTNFGQTLRFTDRVHQAMANYIALAYAAAGPLPSLPEMHIDARAVADPGAIYFYGISQGAILGGTYLALSPNIERATLGVGGANLSFIMYRSLSFSAFLLFIQAMVPDWLDQQKFGLLSQSVFDRIDPFTFAPYVLDHPLPPSPSERRVLMQVGIGDAQVPSICGQLHARALGVRSLQPAPRSIAGVEPAPSPFDGSAIVEFDFGIEPLPDLKARAGNPNEVHEAVRRLEVGMQQIDRFFRPDGLIEHTCSGMCDPD